MASTKLETTKDGRQFYLIRVHAKRGESMRSMRWYVPDGWSRKAIDRELAKVSAEFERQCKAGEILNRQERKEKAAAEAAAAEAARLAAEAEAAKIVTLKQYVERVYMPALTVKCSENTRSSYQGNFDNWIFPALGAIKLRDVSSKEIDALLLDMQSQGKAHGTVIKVYTILSSVFKKAYMADEIEKNPMDKVQRPAPRKDEIKSTEAEAYTVEEMRYILECLDSEPLKWQALIRLLIDSGMRRGECCGLKWSNINFKECQITITGNLCYTPQKGVYLDTPKNGKTRSVDVDPDVMELLRRLRQEQASKALSAYVFTQENSAEPMHPQSPTRYLKKFAERYGIEDLHPHKLRHSFASIAITNGADVASISETLGHSDKAVTLRMYTHSNPENIKKARNIFRDALKPKTEQEAEKQA